MWLVDSGATCHIVSADHLSGFRVCKYHDRTVTLYSASGDIINVSNVVDLEVRFGDVSLTLEDVLVADVPFNVVSPWSASERGWKTHRVSHLQGWKEECPPGWGETGLVGD